MLKITRILKRFLRSLVNFYLSKKIFFLQHVILEKPSLEEENIIKYVRNHFRLDKLRKETIHITIKGIRNLFRLEKEKEEMKK